MPWPDDLRESETLHEVRIGRYNADPDSNVSLGQTGRQA